MVFFFFKEGHADRRQRKAATRHATSGLRKKPAVGSLPEEKLAGDREPNRAARSRLAEHAATAQEMTEFASSTQKTTQGMYGLDSTHPQYPQTVRWPGEVAAKSLGDDCEVELTYTKDRMDRGCKRRRRRNPGEKRNHGQGACASPAGLSC